MFIPFEQEVRIKENIVVAFMEAIEGVSSSVNEPEVYNVDMATGRKIARASFTSFLKKMRTFD